MSARRATARLARRELRRRPATTLLIASLVAVPVAAMILGTVLLRSLPLPAEVQTLRDVGAGQASIVVPQADADAATDALRQTSTSLSIAPLTFQDGSLATPAGERINTEVSTADFDDPQLRPRYRVHEGGMPAEPGDATLSSSIADAWDAEVGDTLRFDELGTEVRVVGIADTVGDDRNEIFLATFPDLDPASVNTQLFVDEVGRLGPDTVATLRSSAGDTGGILRMGPGVDATSDRLAAMTAPTAGFDENVMWTWLGGALALAVMGVIIAAAFAVGARRQLRTLGLLAANGAPPSMVRGVVVWQGVWVGVTGTVVGGVLALAVLVAAWPFHDRLIDHDPTWWAWTPVDLVPIVALGIAASVLAAALPARTAGRISVVRALAGRRPLSPVRMRVVVAGGLAAGAGLGLLAVSVVGQRVAPLHGQRWIAIAIAGGLAVLAGSTMVAPALVGLAGRLGHQLHGGGRLAVRSVARQRSRSGAVVAGVAAAAALCLGTNAALATDQTKDVERRAAALPEDAVVVSTWGSLPSPPTPGPVVEGGVVAALPIGTPGAPAYGPATGEQMAAIDAALPDAVRIDTPVATATATGPSESDAVDPRSWYTAMAAPATPELLDELDVPAAAREALARGETVALGADPALREVSLAAYLGTGFDGGPPNVVAVTPFPDVTAYHDLPSVLLPTSTADAIGLTDASPWDARTLYFTPAPVTDDQRAAVSEAARNRWPTGFVLAGAARPDTDDAPNLSVNLGSPTALDNVDLAMAAIVGGSLVFTSFVVILGLALAARDTRDERDVLEAVGAPPRLLRRVAGLRAGLLALLGALLAAPTGLLPVWVVARASRPVLPFTVPWPSVVFLIVVLPLALGLAALGGGALTSRFRPATGSGFAAD